MKAKASRKKPAATDSEPIHTPLTLDDRDAFELIRRRITWQALLVQHVLSTWDEEHDLMEDRDRATLEEGVIELCAAIVRNSDDLHELIEAAEKRRKGGAR